MIPPSDKYVTAVKFHNITQGQGIAPHCRCGAWRSRSRSGWVTLRGVWSVGVLPR